MTEREVMEYMEDIGKLGIVPGLDSIRELLHRLGDPQKELRFVHIAGTNGKGSVSAYIASVLMCAGYRVGRYLSPVIFEYREKIQINNRCISKAAMCRYVQQIREICGKMVEEGMHHPTPFEVETAMCFLYFRDKKCDVVVLETGMGGLEDATNIVENTQVAVITSVSLDHMKFLGNTLTGIARQKAGIIKKGCMVVSASQKREVLSVIREQAQAKDCPLRVMEPECITKATYGIRKQRFSYKEFDKIEITLAGKYQIENAATALEAVLALREWGYRLSEEQIRKGFLSTVWPGRFTVIGKAPVFVVDGAHNEDAARRLAESVEFYFTNKRIIYIMGVLKDKEYEKIISCTHALADEIITVTPPNAQRALSAYELAQAVRLVHPRVTAADSLEEAVEMSHLLASKEDVIVAFGSLSFMGRLIEIMRDKTGKAVK